jgi:hypothetical protein
MLFMLQVRRLAAAATPFRAPRARVRGVLTGSATAPEPCGITCSPPCPRCAGAHAASSLLRAQLVFTLFGPATAVMQPSFYTPMFSRLGSSTPSKIHPQSIASLAVASAAAAMDKKAVAEAAGAKDHQSPTNPTHHLNEKTPTHYSGAINNVRTRARHSPSAPHPHTRIRLLSPSCLLPLQCVYRP